MFKAYPIGDFHIDIAEVCTEEGKLCLFVATDRTSKLAFSEWHEQVNKVIAAQFRRDLITAGPYKIHSVLTVNSIQFVNRKRDRCAYCHTFDRMCQEYGVDPRLTKTNHPWTDDQVKRMNCALKDAPMEDLSRSKSP
jgi:hypothetical protein